MPKRRLVRFGLALMLAGPVMAAWLLYRVVQQAHGTDLAIQLPAIATTVLILAGPAVAGGWWRGSGVAGAALGALAGAIAAEYAYVLIADALPGEPMSGYETAWSGLWVAMCVALAPLAGLAGWGIGWLIRDFRARPTPPRELGQLR